MQGVAPKYEVVAALRGAAPDVRGLEAATTDPVQVGYQNFVVHRGAVFSRSEILNCGVDSTADQIRTGRCTDRMWVRIPKQTTHRSAQNIVRTYAPTHLDIISKLCFSENLGVNPECSTT